MKLLKDQIESLRYINHLWPVLILRLYISFFFFSRYSEKLGMDFLGKPKLSARIDEFLYSTGPPAWIQVFFVDYVQESWAVWAGLFTNLEWSFGVLFLIGFLNRPGAIIAMLYLYMMSFISSPAEQMQLLPITMILVALMVFGSGRVGGVDYFFYKRKRGLLW
ncbi:MAG: TQO small subunit DoxD [Bdellovibrionales bacterium]